MKSVKTNEAARCPACQTTLSGATHPDDATPSPGDLSVCLYCTMPLRFKRRLDAARDERRGHHKALPPSIQLQLAALRRAAQAMEKKRDS